MNLDDLMDELNYVRRNITGDTTIQDISFSYSKDKITIHLAEDIVVKIAPNETSCTSKNGL